MESSAYYGAYLFYTTVFLFAVFGTAVMFAVKALIRKLFRVLFK